MYDEVLHLYVPTVPMEGEPLEGNRQDSLTEDPSSYIHKQDSVVYDHHTHDLDHNSQLSDLEHEHEHERNQSLHDQQPSYSSAGGSNIFKQYSLVSEFSASSTDAADEELIDTFNAENNINNNRIKFSNTVSYQVPISNPIDSMNHIVDSNKLYTRHHHNYINNNDINYSINNINKEVFVFGFGAIVFWGFHRNEAKELLDYLETFVVKGRWVVT